MLFMRRNVVSQRILCITMYELKTRFLIGSDHMNTIESLQ